MANILYLIALGLLAALNPCQIAINVSALTFLLKQREKGRNSLTICGLYMLGRAFAYIVLAWLLIAVGRNYIQQILESPLFARLEDLLPYIFLLISVFFIIRAFHPHHHHESCHNSGGIIKRRGHLGAFVLGVFLAFAFCPESAFFYFALMLPASLTSSLPYWCPVVFSVGAILPVAAVACLMSLTMHKIKAFSTAVQQFQRLVNALCGLLFLVMAVLLFWHS